MRDDKRSGRERDVRTPDLVEKVRSFLDEDHRVSIETTSTQFEVGVATVRRIIREDLNMHKVCDFVARGQNSSSRGSGTCTRTMLLSIMLS